MLEEGTPSEAGWQLKRWWQMARQGTIDREWEALSYEDGAVMVGGRRHELVRDDRLRDAAAAVASRVRTTAERVANPLEEMPPAAAAYALVMDTVPGWLSSLDFRTLVALDRIQRQQGIGGDLFEIGAYLGQTAILLGYLARAPQERLTVCDIFEHVEGIDDESLMEVQHWYGDLTEKAFVTHYELFHQQLPDVIVGPSERIDAAALAGTCRMVHVDGGHTYDNVRQDAAIARQLLGRGGIVAFDHVWASHTPGVALAVWELVLDGAFVPLCLTADKLYGTWDDGDIDWVWEIGGWVTGERDLGNEMHTLAGRPIRRLFSPANRRSRRSRSSGSPMPRR